MFVFLTFLPDFTHFLPEIFTFMQILPSRAENSDILPDFPSFLHNPLISFPHK